MHPLARDLEAVIFDVGNTLFYLDYERLLAVLIPRGIVPATVTAERAALAERRARVALSAWLQERRASTEDPRSFHRYLELALGELGLAPEGERLEAVFAEVCREHRRENFFAIPAPRALETVTALSRRYRLAVVSNAGGRVRGKLERAGFGPHLLGVVDSGLVGIEKPDARIFRLGCEHAGARPERTLYVGDLHSVDVAGARGAGLRAALLDPAGAYAERGVDDATLVRDVEELGRTLLGADT